MTPSKGGFPQRAGTVMSRGFQGKKKAVRAVTGAAFQRLLCARSRFDIFNQSELRMWTVYKSY